MILKFIKSKKKFQQEKIIRDLKLKCISKYKTNTLLYEIICEMKINKHKGLRKLDRIYGCIVGGYHHKCLECKKILECKDPKDIFHSFELKCKQYKFNKSYLEEN